MLSKVAIATYTDMLDLSGQNLLGLAGKPRDAVKEIIPQLRSPETMARKIRFSNSVRAYNGEFADEIHVFKNAGLGEFRLEQILLKNGFVIGLTFKDEGMIS